MNETSKAKDLAEESSAWHNHVGSAHAEEKDYSTALTDFTEAIRLHPKDAAAYYNRGTAFSQTGDYNRAIADFTDAILLDPELLHAYHNRGYARAARKEYELAIGDYSKAILLDPDDAIAHNCLAWLWAVCPEDRLRDGPKAIEYARRACELTDWTNANHLGTLGAALAEAGYFDEAVKWEKKALQDSAYNLENGEQARQRIRLYEQKKPCRQA
jgi:tetratricopeptide (TPR) repeat protein